MLEAAFALLSAVGIESKWLRDVVFSLFETLKGQFRCEIEVVQTCSRWRANLVTGTLVVTFFYTIFFALCNFFGVTLFGVLSVPLYPFFIWHVCYDYQFFCLPTVPGCFVQDLRATMQTLIPTQMLFPLVLMRDSESCTGTAARVTLSEACILPCTESPLSYTSWHSVAAWLAVEFGAGSPLSNAVEALPDGLIDTDFLSLIIADKNAALLTGGDLVFGNRVCALLNLYRVLPYLFMLVVGSVLVLLVGRFLVTIALSLCMVATRIGVYALTDAGRLQSREQ